MCRALRNASSQPRGVSEELAHCQEAWHGVGLCTRTEATHGRAAISTGSSSSAGRHRRCVSHYFCPAARSTSRSYTNGYLVHTYSTSSPSSLCALCCYEHIETNESDPETDSQPKQCSCIRSSCNGATPAKRRKTSSSAVDPAGLCVSSGHRAVCVVKREKRRARRCTPHAARSARASSCCARACARGRTVCLCPAVRALTPRANTTPPHNKMHATGRTARRALATRSCAAGARARRTPSRRSGPRCHPAPAAAAAAAAAAARPAAAAPAPAAAATTAAAAATSGCLPCLTATAAQAPPSLRRSTCWATCCGRVPLRPTRRRRWVRCSRCNSAGPGEGREGEGVAAWQSGLFWMCCFWQLFFRVARLSSTQAPPLHTHHHRRPPLPPSTPPGRARSRGV